MIVGTARADLEFPDGLGLYGFGPFGGAGFNLPKGSAESDTLQVRALYVEEGDQKLLMVSCDLPCGSRTLQYALRAGLERCGVKLEDGQIWVMGTHTHSAPGHFLGSLYDWVGQWPLGYRPLVTAEIVRKALAAALDAMRAESLRACRVGVAQQVLWGAGRNRSFRPFLENFGGELGKWAVELDIRPDAALTPEECAIDPRLTVVAFVGTDGLPLATWATWSCHPATIHRAEQRPYHRDWPGVAVDLTERELAVPMAIMSQGPSGDVTPLPSGELRVLEPMKRIRELGEAIANAWVLGFAKANADAERRTTASGFEVAFTSFVPADEGLPEFEIGAPVIVGSEEFDPFFPTKIIGEARLFPYRRDAQCPKLPALGPLQYPLRKIPSLRPSARHPMWLLRFADHLFFASPFEQTTYAARTTEILLQSRWSAVRREPLASASAVGLVGDYAGYLATAKEFKLQNYEGAHTLYGRDQCATLGRIWSDLITPTPLDARSPGFQSNELELFKRAHEALRLT